MIILVINCGSSSIKYQLLDMKNDDVYDVLAKGIVEKSDWRWVVFSTRLQVKRR